MRVELRQLEINNGADEYDMLQEIDSNENGFTNEVKGMSYDKYRDWLVQQDDFSKAKNLPENWIPQTIYFLYVDDRPVGFARIRHYSSDFLEKQGVGNFGYGIAKPYRGNGYGSILFREVIKKCKLLGYSKIRSFINVDNVASNKVFLKNGARLVGVFKGAKNIYETECES